MTTDQSLAFAHPEARSRAEPGVSLRDRISLRDYVVEAEIGAFQQERGQRQRIRFNVVVELRPNDGPLDDDVDRILSYDRITEAIAAALGAMRLNLLETLAEQVAERILVAPQAMRVFVRIEKLDRGPGALGVEIMRARAEAAPAADLPVPHPLVVHLDTETLDAPDLAARLDTLSARGLPVVLTVGLPDSPRPVTGHRPTQRRIDLLAMEQQAWVLAARDPRCLVVATRTEIDWAIRQGRMIVWAPSKLVLDAVEGPVSLDPVALAVWLAEALAATGLVLHGAVSAPADCRVPVERA